VKREAVIAGLASEGLALILGSAEAGSRCPFFLDSWCPFSPFQGVSLC